MSYLTRRTARARKSGLSLFENVVEVVDDCWHEYVVYPINSVKHVCKNIYWMWPHIKRFRTFDSSYNIELFCDSLNQTAHGLKNGHCVGAEKAYRRTLTASRLLRDAYLNEYTGGKAHDNWMKNNVMYFEECEMKTKSKYPKEYSDKMWKQIRIKTDRINKERKEYAMRYLEKYIQSMWD